VLFSLFSSRPISREKNCRQFALLSGQWNIPALAQRIVEEPEQLALQLLIWTVSESIRNHDSKIVDAGSVD